MITGCGDRYIHLGNPNKEDAMENERFQRGWEKLREIEGDAGERVMESLKDISPDMGRYIIEYSFGDVYSRDGLTLKYKEIAVVAALVAMGNAAPQLKVHLNGALNVGCSLDEIKEIILQMSAYAGFPAAINGMNALKEVLVERKEVSPGDDSGEKVNRRPPTDRYETGVEWLSKLDPEQVKRLEAHFEDIMPDMARYTIEYVIGDIYSRPGLDLKSRQIATIAALTALGTASAQLRFHINAGLNVGLTEQEIIEVMIMMSVYAGFPSALNGIFTAKEVFQAR
jgi:4-carboxymuconolactone decarboxylase